MIEEMTKYRLTQLLFLNAGLMELVKPLVKIGQKYHDNNLDNDARKTTDEGENKKAPKDIILYTGRGGGTLLTLRDCLEALDFAKEYQVSNYQLGPDDVGLFKLWDEHAEWSQATFGKDTERGPLGALKHLELEAREAHNEKDLEKRKVELADCLLLVMDAARRCGMTPLSLIETTYRKLQVCKEREYPKPVGDNPSQHVKK